MNCRHCGKAIKQGTGPRWVHLTHLYRCRQPEDIAVYGYEAMPDDGEECVCWACLKYGPIGVDVERLADAAIAADTEERDERDRG